MTAPHSKADPEPAEPGARTDSQAIVVGTKAGASPPQPASGRVVMERVEREAGRRQRAEGTARAAGKLAATRGPVGRETTGGGTTAVGGTPIVQEVAVGTEPREVGSGGIGPRRARSVPTGVRPERDSLGRNGHGPREGGATEPVSRREPHGRLAGWEARAPARAAMPGDAPGPIGATGRLRRGSVKPATGSRQSATRIATLEGEIPVAVTSGDEAMIAITAPARAGASEETARSGTAPAVGGRFRRLNAGAISRGPKTARHTSEAAAPNPATRSDPGCGDARTNHRWRRTST